MVRRALVVLCLGLMTVLLAGCGQTYKLQSITVSPAGYSVSGPGNGALAVTANYSNSKTAIVTTKSSYEVLSSSLMTTTAPQGAVSVNDSGIVTVSGATLACTWAAVTTGGTTTYASSPYQVQVVYTEDGVTATALVPIDVATAPGCDGQSSSTTTTSSSMERAR